MMVKNAHAGVKGKTNPAPKVLMCLRYKSSLTGYLTPWRLGGFGDFRKKIAVFGCLTNALAPPPIALESCSMAQTDRPV